MCMFYIKLETPLKLVFSCKFPMFKYFATVASVYFQSQVGCLHIKSQLTCIHPQQHIRLRIISCPFVLISKHRKTWLTCSFSIHALRNEEDGFFIACGILKNLCQSKEGHEITAGVLQHRIKRLCSVVEDLEKKVEHDKR